jgi:hypothetical protein
VGVMKSFEEQFVHEFYMGKNNKGEYIDDRTRMASFCYEAGKQSKQAEVDELKREMLNKTNEAYADGQKSMRKMIKSNEDDLQKRIDEAFKSSKEFYDFGDGESAMAFCNEIMNILKGNTNEH